MSEPSIILADGSDRLIDLAAKHLESCLTESFTSRGRASLMLSGGSSPKPIYQKLAQSDLDWDGVGIGLVDERWVPPGAVGSNADFIEACFSGTPAERSHRIPLYNGHKSASEGVPGAEQALALLARPFDVCVMGMGLDGHTASWFPNSGGLQAALDPDNSSTVAAIDATGCEVAGAHPERMTLTYSAVASARHVVLLLPSAEKLSVFRAAKSRNLHDMPVKALFDLGSKLTVFALKDDR